MSASKIKKTVIFIVGPTAIGKTRLAVRLAKRINGEIISSDSMQVYRGMAILSQSPTAEYKEKVKHHLIGILDPAKEYSVAVFRARASGLIDSIIGQGKTPIVVGGSGLYVKALIDGIFPSPEADTAFRLRLTRMASRLGKMYLYNKLSKVDPETAKGIHPNDLRRIIRALEIHHSTGRTMSELKKETRGLKDHYKIKMFGLIRPREEIYSDINSRVRDMFTKGLSNEVRRLTGKKLSKTARSVMGYKEIMGYLRGKYDLNTAKEMLKMNTRRFAKRQLTWFRADKRIVWFDTSKISERRIIDRIIKEC